MIAYTETRLELVEDTASPLLLYVALTPETAAVAEVYVRRSVFDGPAPKEIVLTVTPQ